MKEELKIFFTALMFYTRIPCPKGTDHSPDYINKASRYFPLIGWIVGGISFIVYYVSSLLFHTELAVVLSLVAGVLVTGAFHEDGLADVFDAFGGGWTKEKILEIMKDSRIGTYGVVALIFMFGLKYFSLYNVTVCVGSKDTLQMAIVFITYHALARLTAIQIVFSSQYVREDENSKAKPIAKQHTSKEKAGAYILGLIPLTVMCFIQWKCIFILLPLFLLYYFSKKYFEKWIDGYTGDCLGAVEQMAECIILLSFVSIWKFM